MIKILGIYSDFLSYYSYFRITKLVMLLLPLKLAFINWLPDRDHEKFLKCTLLLNIQTTLWVRYYYYFQLFKEVIEPLEDK